MSFVSVLQTEDFLTIVSDGRVVAANNENMILNEQYQKFILPTNQTFLAFAGDQPSCEAVAQRLVPLLQQNLNVEAIGDEIAGILADKKYEGYKVLVAYGGRTNEGKISFATYNSSKPGLKVYEAVGDQINYAFLWNSNGSDLRVEKVLEECLSKATGLSSSEFIKAQEALNNIVAKHDKSVNCVTFSAAIAKGPSAGI